MSIAAARLRIYTDRTTCQRPILHPHAWFQVYTVTILSENPWRRLRPLCLALLYACCVAAFAADAPQEIVVPAWFKNSFLDLRDDIKEAAAARKRVMIYFGQNGCPYCKKLMEVNFRQQDIIEKTRRHFDALEINIFGSREVTWLDGRTLSEKEFAALLKVQFTPTLLFLDEKGNVALRVNGYYPPERFRAALDYVSLHEEAKMSFAEFQKSRLREADSGTLHDEPFFRKPPYVFDRRKPSARPLAIFFEQRNCPDCDELHATALKATLTRTLLTRFEVYRLDVQGNEAIITPAGAKTTAAQWARDLNVLYVPSIVLIDRNGKEILRVEAYVRTFHLQSALDYVASGTYLKEPNFQRFIQMRGDAIRERGGRIDVMQ
jgi:thioredoxin-related protein